MNRSDPPQYDFFDPPAKEGEIGRLGPYRVTGTLGKGGMGQVFLAEDARLKRRVALKVMNQKFASTPNSKQRFVEEARAMAAVHHDNVATIFEVGLRSGMPFIAMEMLKGKTLEAWQAEGRPFTTEQILELARDVAAGLAAAHACGIVHRDIKPANIWIEESGRAKILDFGLAIAGADRFSRRGAVIGTPGYLSPEQARNEPLDDRTDLFSLGVVLYQMCAGKLPLMSGSITGQMIAIIAHRPPPLQSLNPDIPAPLSDLVSQLMEKEPRDRPRSAAALEQQVLDVVQQCRSESQAALQIVTAAATPIPAKVTKKAKATKKQSEAESVASTRRRWWWWLPWASAALLLLVVVAVAMTVRPRTVANRPSALRSDGNSKTQPTQTVVRAAPLGVLVLSPATVEVERVPRGHTAIFRMQIENRALDARSDPKRLYSDVPVITQVIAWMTDDDGATREAPMFPRELTPSQLPRPGKSSEIEIMISTAEMVPGNYEFEFQLQTPGGVTVDSSSASLTVIDGMDQGKEVDPK